METHEIIAAIDFTREDYEKKEGDLVSFDQFIENIVQSCRENNGTIEDAVFIANDAYSKL